MILVDKTLSGASTSGQSELGAMALKEYSTFSKSPRLDGASPSNGLFSYLGRSLGGSFYSTAEKQSVYSSAPTDWAETLGEKLDGSIQGSTLPRPSIPYTEGRWSKSY